MVVGVGAAVVGGEPPPREGVVLAAWVVGGDDDVVVDALSVVVVVSLAVVVVDASVVVVEIDGRVMPEPFPAVDPQAASSTWPAAAKIAPHTPLPAARRSLAALTMASAATPCSSRRVMSPTTTRVEVMGP